MATVGDFWGSQIHFLKTKLDNKIGEAERNAHFQCNREASKWDQDSEVASLQNKDLELTEVTELLKREKAASHMSFPSTPLSREF